MCAWWQGPRHTQNFKGVIMNKRMNKWAALSIAGVALVSGAVSAQEVGRVISSTPIISQVVVPRQVCNNEVVQVQTQVPGNKSGAGALMGGIAGGAMGNAVGQGSGRAAATLLGVFAGAIMGDKIEGGTPATVATQQQNVQRCATQNFIENRATAYNVVYEYACKQYSVQLPQDPGPSIQLQVSPVMAQPPVTQAPAPAVPVVTAPATVTTVVESGVVYQPYVRPVVVAPYYSHPYPAYGPLFTGGLVIRAGGHGHGHGHGHLQFR
jgi:uncharacterized protein YcfJ